MIGTVLVVRDERLGAEVTGFGALYELIYVDDISDFNEDGGQLVYPSGAVLTYTGVDADALSLRVEVGDAFPLVLEDWVAPWSSDHEDTERVAEVDTGDGPPLIAVVPHSLRPLLPPGTREPGTEESVDTWEILDGQVEVRTVLGKEPGIVGPSIDVPGLGEVGFHVAADGTAAFGAASTEDEDGTFWRIGHLGDWATLVGFVEGVDNPARIEVAASAPGPSQSQALSITSPRDDALSSANISLVSVTAPSDFSYIAAVADIISLYADPITMVGVVQWGGGQGNGFSELQLNDVLLLAKRNADPTTPPAGFVKVYSKVIAGNSKLFAMGDDGTPHALW